MAKAAFSTVTESIRAGSFGEVLRAEHAAIDARRTSFAAPRPKVVEIGSSQPDKAVATGFAVYDTIGLALSGGGIRSASFCLGALQALDERVGMRNIDYLSTVSGGGYIGSSLTATTLKTGGKFAFSCPDDFSDLRAVQHIRDYSNYIFPRGRPGVVFDSLAVVFRGWVTNLALIFVFALAAAILTILAYPDRASLHAGSFVPRLLDSFCQATNICSARSEILTTWTGQRPFGFTLFLLVVFSATLLGWAVWRSRTDGRGNDVRGPALKFVRWSILLLLVTAFLDLQPVLLGFLFRLDGAAQQMGGFWDGLKTLITTLTPLGGVAAFLSTRLSSFLKTSRQSRTRSVIAARLGAQAIVWFAALAAPLIVWLFYLLLAASGIEDPCHPVGYPFAHGFIDASGTVGVPLTELRVGFLPAYSTVFLLFAIMTLLFKPNANSLHRLYRDRLSKAFLFDPENEAERGSDKGDLVPVDGLKLHEISPPNGGPYHLINSALNLQSSRKSNRRGRNADFFIFSSRYIGSDATDYVKTERMEEIDPQIDLATAMAISGAAISSDMGSASVRQLAPTLALLNLRLGYWMRNPAALEPSRKGRAFDLTKFYLALEMFGLLDESRRRVYLTDGGHLENLGLYQLLKRGCRAIFVVDAEADPHLEFPAFVKLERYARIDMGIRIDLPIDRIREAVNRGADYGAKRLKRPDRAQHCAIGTIHYPNGIDGVLFYVKSCTTGDENDYIRDYKFRNPSFPHESTGDQFFTEEQFEVYRALGFHAVDTFFNGGHDVTWTKDGRLEAVDRAATRSKA